MYIYVHNLFVSNHGKYTICIQKGFWNCSGLCESKIKTKKQKNPELSLLSLSGSSIPVNGTFRPSPSAMVRPQQQPSTIAPVATVIRQNHPVKTTLRRVSETTLPSTGSSATLNARDAAVNGTLTKQITPQSILVKPDSNKNSSEKVSDDHKRPNAVS